MPRYRSDDRDRRDPDIAIPLRLEVTGDHPMSEPRFLIVRNEVDPDCEYHCDALAASFPDRLECDYPAGERPGGETLDVVDGVVLTGSTAGVYERDDRPWIDEQEALVRELVEKRAPALGVCFGHQIANTALDGTVEAVETTSRLVTADFADDPLFDGVSAAVPAVHGDAVIEPGEGMEPIASADYYPAFATRHREAPLWTIQFHPEFTADYRDRIDDDFGWTATDLDYEDVTAERVFENFRRVVAALAA